MFWHPQHLRNLPELAALARADRERLVSLAFFLVIAVSIAGNFAAGFWCSASATGAPSAPFPARLPRLRRAPSGSRGHAALVYLWLPAIGFSSGVFGLFTMYLPPLFPTLLRTTGAGFSYNIGRLAAAAGTVLFGLLAPVGDFRLALLLDGVLFLAAAGLALTLPDPGEA